MEWVLENLNEVLSVVSLLAVAVVYLYLRYYQSREQLEKDLRQLIRDGMDFLKDWAGDQVAEVTQEQVYQAADWFYRSYVEGTPLGHLVDKEGLRAMFWSAFCRWRDQFVGARAMLLGAGFSPFSRG